MNAMDTARRKARDLTRVYFDNGRWWVGVRCLDGSRSNKSFPTHGAALADNDTCIESIAKMMVQGAVWQ